MAVKLGILAICIAIMSTLLIFSTSATDTAAIRVRQILGQPGDTVTVAMLLDSNPGIAGLSLKVTYDESRLFIDNQNAVNRGLALPFLSYIGVNEKSYNNNPFTVLWYGTMNDTTTGVLLNVTFTILDGAPAGAAYVNVICTLGDAVNLKEEYVPISVTQGGVTISHDDNYINQDPISPIPTQPKTPGNTTAETPSAHSQTSALDKNIQYIDIDTLPSSIQQVVADNKAFIVSGEQIGEKTKISVPYLSANGKTSNSLVVYKVEQDGKTEIIKQCFYNRGEGTVDFLGTIGDLYFVGTNHVVFIDVAPDAWYYEAVTFTAARNVFIGVGENRFAPSTSITRGMFITALANLDGADISVYIDSPFSDTDIKAWYGPYIAWAKELDIINEGILTGYKPGNFNPGDNITREQMAVMFANYISAKRLMLPEKEVEAFSDIEQASDWAKDAIHAMRRYSIISGMGGNRYNPASTATRVEVAQIFCNLINAMIG